MQGYFDATAAQPSNKSKSNEYKCPYCPKVMKKKVHIDEHIRIHTGEKPFECPICGKGFNKNFTRKDHMRRIHKTDYETFFEQSFQ